MSELKIAPGKIVTGIGAIAAAALFVLWGVPYYLKAEVHDLYVAELTASPHPVTTNDLAETTAAVTAVQLQLVSMEKRMIARDELFMNYLQDQASRGTNN